MGVAGSPVHDRLADQALAEMLRFRQGVIEYQTRDLRPEDFDYSAIGFEALCQGFRLGAMMVVSERYSFPTGPGMSRCSGSSST